MGLSTIGGLAMFEKKLNKILLKYNGSITGANDLTADAKPSVLFYFLADRLSYLLDNDPQKVVSAKGITWRRKFQPIIKKLGVHFLSNPQIIENRNFLRNPQAVEIAPDPGIVLPNEPVIWAANHSFKDDTLATILAAKRHAYILFGSLPQFYNTFDGVVAWLNGVVMTNRKVAASRHSSVPKAVKAMHLGTDMLIFPEGVWNKSPNALILDLWSGIYRIACETGAKVVPVVHYIRDCTNKGKNNPIHTVVDDPIRIDDLSESAALILIRDVLATWFYLMMDVYGKSTNDQILNGCCSATQAWEQSLANRIKTANRYDTEIELCADYRPKWKIDPRDVWRSIADIEKLDKRNITEVEFARQLIFQKNINDFQHRF